MIETTDRFSIVCPKCKHQWLLSTEDLNLRSCESGGIYACNIECPNCKFEQDLLDY